MEVPGFDMEQHQVNLNHYFEGSTRRKRICLIIWVP